jgi:3-phenylpropionate/trans-cinnamate dioxygenase ferredoxin subunit
MARHVVAAARDLPDGSRLAVTLEGRPIVVFSIAGAFYALLNRCPHQGGPLCEGSLGGMVEASEPGQYRYTRAGEILRCPWHGWEFDVRTGQSWWDPSRVRVRTYPAAVETGAALVEGPYVAEIFAVSVEDEYVVLDIN